ncbi:MAG: methylthioadenosine phosphorylase [Gammaproteobacteria bacterium RIFCSPHIGHO2_12_FULL_35_23]|nr:MAG: methylthioadenosine phosphorylase [Gammaproteobacteria bacterium RIFCSPHIGHO2_12_FULL_35_23]
MIKAQADIAIIGGTGVNDISLLTDIQRIELETPYGKPSDAIVIGEFNHRKIAFLPRHGKNHSYAPHKINYRANIYALKQLGVKRILAACAVGSLQPEYKPGELVFVDQFIDWTKLRINTFYEEENVYHVSLAEPVCKELRQLGIKEAEQMGLAHHQVGTYICIPGPRYSTRAESIFFKDVLKVQVVGMTMATECTLARELEMCYMPIACVTDYDAWTNNLVSAKEVREVMQANVLNVKELIFKMLAKIPNEQTDQCICWHALQDAKQ